MSQILRLVSIAAVGLWGVTACASRSPQQVVEDSSQACCQGRYPKATFPTTSTAQLGADYKRLKRRKCPACARFGSDFHVLLRELGQRLDGQPRSTLQQVLGRPDRVRGDSLVYYWRGEHDYLYFRLGADQCGHSAWYYAYE
jgi:hypothetical protein